MKKSNSILTLALVAGLSFSLLACGNSKSTDHNDDNTEHDHSGIDHAAEHKMPDGSVMEMSENKSISQLIDQYLAIKNALVQDDSKAAASAGQKLAEEASSIDVNTFEVSKQPEIKEILEVVKEHGEHIAKSEIAHQREHFEGMAKDFMDLLAITGTDRTLYQQYCPMYDKGKGGSWLSDSQEIKNPLFGSKMLTCGSVKETISMK
ncbi:DUF3347 domain-containing protein [Cyclobacterium marinum]|uniref:DUF3347 domain-containing protein n=1 Tax=Cyclobacterium marinum (strain ATCC 25205 / DSM 745 / LMG 13164 / NCIMB 1802) TaxID=880070 RepID=G0IWM3_CYCMS|nr:DUF3347 domain-containing protein [Cyclobacterium marinum]AEL28017.1 hypothetical protein Cycma_4314 [Cyclobacterium marinum DSM 745]